MKRLFSWHTIFLVMLLAISVQGCLGIGDNTSNQNFKPVNAGNGQNLQVNTSNQALFKGKIYFTQRRNLFVIDGARNFHRLTSGSDVRDPAVSPNGKWIAFVVRHKYASDLVYMSTNGGRWTTLRSGSGQYIPNPPFAPNSTYRWYAQPAWGTDSTHLLFLCDLEKLNWFSATGEDAPLLDLQVYSISKNNPSHVQDVAYGDYGDGGDRDPSYRPGPGHTNQIVYTHYTYDKTETQQVIQIFLEDATMIANHPNAGYHPGTAGSGYDPAVPITPYSTSVANLEPAFSPDGNYLAYIRRIDPSHMGLYVMPVAENVTSNPNNSAVQKRALQPYQKSSLIVSGQYVSQPVWSPDGKQIAYLSYNNNEFDIWLANVSIDAKTGAYHMTGSPVPLTNGGVDADSRPFWTA